ncbi:VOC family protein [candidate division KSB1 bacterium]|nr:VOC family protein [candidate division KSB1 bacterium]
MIKRIDHTTITVRNLEKSIDFYTSLLGFTVAREMWLPEEKLRIVFLRSGDTTLELFGVPEIHGEMISHANEVVGYKHIALLVDSVDEEYQRLSEAGVKFHLLPETIQDMVRIAFFRDPDGMDIELIEYLP